MRNLMVKAIAWKAAHQAREEGQTVVEYALVVGLVSLALIVILVGAGTTWIQEITTLVTARVPNA